MDELMNLETITVLLSIVSVLGTIGTFYFGIKSNRLEKQRYSLTWKEVETGSLQLLRESESKFHPDILLMISGPSAIVASLAMIQSRQFFPVYTAVLENKRELLFKYKPKGHTEISTTKWNIYLPEQLCREVDKRILVIHDCVMSGDVQATICHFLLEKGFPRDHIFLATLVCSELAFESKKAPDYHWYKNPHKDLYFPWGRWF